MAVQRERACLSLVYACGSDYTCGPDFPWPNKTLWSSVQHLKIPDSVQNQTLFIFSDSVPPNILWMQNQKRGNPGDGFRPKITKRWRCMTTLYSTEHMISDLNRCPTLSNLSRTCGQLHKCFLRVYRARWPQFPAWRSLMSLKSTARRFWFVQTTAPAIVSGPVQTMSPSLNRRRMPKWTRCRWVRLWRVSLRLMWLVLFHAYSNAKLPAVGHPPNGTVTPWPWGGCAWIRPRTLIDTHQSTPFSRQKVRLSEGPWTQWPMDGLLLLHHHDLASDFFYVSMGWIMMPLLSAIQSHQVFAVQSSNAQDERRWAFLSSP